jgi:hypothetical protein
VTFTPKDTIRSGGTCAQVLRSLQAELEQFHEQMRNHADDLDEQNPLSAFNYRCQAHGVSRALRAVDAALYHAQRREEEEQQ